MRDMRVLSPLDGRYREAVEPLVDRISEFALNQARLRVEVEWLVHLAATRAVPGLRELTADEVALLRGVPAAFDRAGAEELARLEARTDHDVKAVEYYLKDRLSGTTLQPLAEFVHFCCTSEDVNNLAYALMVRDAVREVWLPAASALQREVLELAVAQRARPMLSRTHGQPATPTTLGKELAVFAHRLGRQLDRVAAQQYLGKINGATGTYAAHTAAAPGTDWVAVSRGFVEHLGLTWNPLTTQIESHDGLAELFADVARYNGILHNLDTDVWTYISLGYFRQSPVPGAVGSSTMPHKINPIRFENSEANLEISTALFRVLQETLVTSRLQRDLTDSTTLRNIGVAFGHSLLAVENTRRGLRRLEVDDAALDRDLADAWEVLGEAVQSVMRRVGLDQPYERLKELTRGRRIDRQGLHDFVRGLGLPPAEEKALLDLTPADYTGLAADLVDFASPRGLDDPHATD